MEFVCCGPFDNFFYAGAIFLIFVKKCKKCPLPYEEVLGDIIKTIWTEQCGNLKEMGYLGKAALVYPGYSLGEVLFACPALPHGAHRGRVKMEVS